MFLVRKQPAIVLAILVPLAILGGGFWVWHVAEPRYVGETILFGSICLTLAIAVLSFLSLRGSLAVRRVFDRILRTRDRSRFTTEFQLRNLGSLGTQIMKLLDETITISEQRRRKLTGTVAMTRFLLNNSDLPALITDGAGTILFTGPAVEGKISEPRSSLSGRAVEDFFPELGFHTLYAELHRTGGSVERKAGKQSVYAYPVYDEFREISYVLLSIGKQAQFEMKPHITAGPTEMSGASPRGGRFSIGRLMETLRGKRP